MNVHNCETEIERMNEGGCKSCAHYGECMDDLLKGMSFSDTTVGSKCKGYETKAA